MSDNQKPRWLEWAQEIQALSQTGYHYAESDYERERYHRLMEIAAEIVSVLTGLEFSPVVEIFREQLGYATPKVDVRGAVFQDGKLLLVRERADGGWTMPGDETSEVSFFDLDEIPHTLSGERTEPRHIRDAFTAFANTDCHTIYD